MKRVHIVGNGPSWIQYKKIDKDDVTIGCNITRAEDASYTTLSDLRLVYKIREKKVFVNCPVLVNTKVHNYLTKDPKGIAIGLEIKDVYQRLEVERLEMSSGHYAARWAVKHIKPEEVHVWGVDSMFHNHMLSHTDEIVEHTIKSDEKGMAKNSAIWRRAWKDIENENPTVKFIYHAPTSE